MHLSHFITINLLNFIKTGEFDHVKPGQTKEWIINNFPDPDSTSNNNKSSIWFYGNIEFHFDEDILTMIYSDYIDSLEGGDSLILNKWIFEEPGKLTLEYVTNQLAKERIGYKLQYETVRIGYTWATIQIIESGVELGFGLPEDEEDLETAPEQWKTADSNLFKLSWFALKPQTLAHAGNIRPNI